MNATMKESVKLGNVWQRYLKNKSGTSNLLWPKPRLCSAYCNSMGALKSQVLENASMENVEITMELPLLVEWVSLCLGFYLQGGPKLAPFLYALTLPHINRFSQLFTVGIRRKFVIILPLKIPFPPHPTCLYTTSWNVGVLKATIENKRRAVAARTARSRVNLYTHCLGI